MSSNTDICIAGKRFVINKYRQDFERANGGIHLPTPKQFNFVKALFEGKGMIASYHAAGYKHKGKPRDNWQQAQDVLRSEGVQTLIGAVLKDYIRAREMSIGSIVDKAFHTYDNASTAREQLDVLKFIARLAGHV
jgi:hypothetical protein